MKLAILLVAVAAAIDGSYWIAGALALVELVLLIQAVQP